MTAYRDLVPVIVVTGFLGSGKTTLLNRLLRAPALADAAVLINEFGDVALDHHLVESFEDTTVVLASGCVCCTIRDDLRQAMLDLHERRERGTVPRYRRVVVETTGLADPVAIMHTLMADPQLRHHYRLGTVIATLDAQQGALQLARYPEVARQVVAADRLVLTKLDVTGGASVEALRARLGELNPTATILDATPIALDVSALLAADLHDDDRRVGEVERWFAARAATTPAAHLDGTHSFCVRHDGALDWSAFGIWLTMLLHTHGRDVLRVKGLLEVVGADTPVVVNGVQHVVHPPFHLERWPGGERGSRIVFIVRGLARAPIERSLAVFNRLA